VTPLVAILGPTATGKSALAIALAERLGGEVVGCDSTAVYRRFDIGTDKVPLDEQRGIPHHLIDIVEPTEAYSAARYANDAAAAIRGIHARGRVAVLAGGTGLYYRALTRGMFPGPQRDEALRAELDARAAAEGVEALHAELRRVDSASADRILPRDQKRIVRALEVYRLTGRPITEHFASTVSPIAGLPVIALGLQIPAALTAERVARRVDQQFARGVVAEVQARLAEGVPEHAHPFTGLVYRQVLEYLHGVRDLDATRALIVAENRRYARRQLIWFRKEPNLHWLAAPGEAAGTVHTAIDALRARGLDA
jgi:tRNA dimethylallyltransferase